jgi:hypothetical protein
MRLSIIKFMVDLVMTRLAQGHQVIWRVPAALRYRQNVVDFLNRCEPPFFQAPLTQRMRRHILVSDSFPRSSVLLIDVGRAFVFVVLPARLCFVFFAVLPVTQVGTSGIGARALWLPWHTVHLASLYKKSSRGNPREPFLFSFPIIMIS